MADIDEPSGPSHDEIAKREQEEKERKAKEDAEQAKLPYKWTQTIRDADVAVPVPGTVKGRDLDVVLTKTKIKVGLKGQEPIIEVHTYIYIPRFIEPHVSHITYVRFFLLLQNDVS